MLNNMDKGMISVLVMLDLSAAFDTIDHQILVQRMKDIFGVQGDALKWVASYPTEWYQVVNIDGHISSSAQLLYGVPQGSVMGPKKYTMYTKPLGEIIRKHGLGYHIYADDTQLYIAFKGDDEKRKCLNTMEACLLDVQKWMAANLLKLNNDKTEVVLFAPKQITVSMRNISVAVGNTHVSAITSVRNLGVMLDTTLSMDDQVKAVCRTAYAQLRGIGHIRRYLTTDAAKNVVNSLVTTRLDYCNSLLYGIPGRLLARLQKVQNTAARIVSRTSRYAHITPVLQELYWLPIESRLKYKVLLMAHRALHGSAPQYLADMLTIYQPGRSLRSQSTTRRVVPKGRTVTYGDRCFSRAAPILWNTLPSSLQNTDKISTFKAALKTYLFRQCYTC